MPRIADRMLAPPTGDDFLPKFRASLDPDWIEEGADLIVTSTVGISEAFARF